jgi:hypothetical protein
MKDLYRVIVSTSQRAAPALGELVTETGAPSRHLSLARAAALEQGGPPQPVIEPEIDLGALRPRLRTFGRPKGWRVTRLDEVDAPAVVRAYQEEQLSLRECAFRFATTDHLIQAILRDNGIQIRPASQTELPAGNNEPSPPSAKANTAPPTTASTSAKRCQGRRATDGRKGRHRRPPPAPRSRREQGQQGTPRPKKPRQSVKPCGHRPGGCGAASQSRTPLPASSTDQAAVRRGSAETGPAPGTARRQCRPPIPHRLEVDRGNARGTGPVL